MQNRLTTYSVYTIRGEHLAYVNAYDAWDAIDTFAHNAQISKLNLVAKFHSFVD